MHFCTGTVACVYNILTIFSLSSLYLTLSSLSLLGTQFSLSLISSIFLPLINLSSTSFCRSPPLPIAITTDRSLFLCFSLFSGWMGLNVSHHRHRHFLPLEASILFLVLAIAIGGVDLVAQGEASILISGFWSILLGLFFWFSAGGLCGFRCDIGVDSGYGSVAVWQRNEYFISIIVYNKQTNVGVL